jgi:type I restriction enzyme R subunit
VAGVTDPNIVHETMAKLDASTIYLESEVEGLVRDYLAHVCPESEVMRM